MVPGGKRNADIGAVSGISTQKVTDAVRDDEEKREGNRAFNSEFKRIKKCGEVQSVRFSFDPIFQGDVLFRDELPGKEILLKLG